MKLKSQVCLQENQRKQGKLHEHQPCPSRIPQDCHCSQAPMCLLLYQWHWALRCLLSLPPCWQDRAVIPTSLCPWAMLAVPYQVACGTGHPRVVQARVTSMFSQTPCARSGIQNMGARPERSSRSSFSRQAFSTACAGRHGGKAGQRGDVVTLIL